jgi:hypothetical protein
MLPRDQGDLAIVTRVSLPNLARTLFAQEICVAEQIARACDPEQNATFVLHRRVEGDHSLSNAIDHVPRCARKENDLPVRVCKIRAATYELLGDLRREIEIDEALLEYRDAVENRTKPLVLGSIFQARKSTV